MTGLSVWSTKVTIHKYLTSQKSIKDVLSKLRFVDWASDSLKNIRASIRTAIIDARVMKDDHTSEYFLILGGMCKMNDTFLIPSEVLPGDPVDCPLVWAYCTFSASVVI